MSVKNISSTVTVTTTATYSWNILSTTCGTQITMSNPTTGTLQPGTTTLTQTVTFPDTCLVNICLEVTEELNCVEQVCFDLSDGSVFTDYSWNCVTISESQKTCIVEETSLIQQLSQTIYVLCKLIVVNIHKNYRNGNRHPI